jgi:hypothetical protein
MSLVEQTNNLYAKRSRGREDVNLLDDAFNLQESIEKKFQAQADQEVNDLGQRRIDIEDAMLENLKNSQAQIEANTLARLEELSILETERSTLETIVRLQTELNAKFAAANKALGDTRQEFAAARENLAGRVGQLGGILPRDMVVPLGVEDTVLEQMTLRDHMLQAQDKMAATLLDENLSQEEKNRLLRQQLETVQGVELKSKSALDIQKQLTLAVEQYLSLSEDLNAAQDESTYYAKQIEASEKLGERHGVNLKIKELERKEMEAQTKELEKQYKILESIKQGTFQPNMSGGCGGTPGAANGMSGMDNRNIRIGRGEMVMNRMATRAMLPQLVSANAGFQNTGGVGGGIY